MRTLSIILAVWALVACASTGSGPEAGGSAAAPATEDKRVEFGNQAAIASVPPAEEDDPGYWEEMICKNEGATGSRQVRRRCHTRYDWARMESAATETMRDIDSQPRGWKE
ncbi:MAG TPA: hypothetical protein VMQ83_07340 [Gammaproteobacteria bacterium]|nr:hypothetical protein [Gammaproteobacteria bacterium]